MNEFDLGSDRTVEAGLTHASWFALAKSIRVRKIITLPLQSVYCIDDWLRAEMLLNKISRKNNNYFYFTVNDL